MRSTKIAIGVASAVTVVLALMLAGLATGAGTSGAATPIGSGKASATKSVCGLGTGKKATGRPIKLGGIDMLIPGVDFTTIGKVAKAYFDCVNDNGGIRGRPISYTLYNEQLNPAQQASLARKLVESDKVVGIVGNTSFTECGTNWKYYKSKGYTVIGAGVQAECFGTPDVRRGEHGPALLEHRRRAGPRPRGCEVDRRRHHLRRSRRTRTAASSRSRRQPGIPGKSVPVTVPVTDANTIVQQLYQAAGPGGGIILDFTPDTAPALMKAAEAQGLIDKVKWGSSTPIANTFMAGQFGNWDGKLFINSEFGLLDPSQGPDTRLMLAILKKYTKIDPQAFAQMGFMAGKFATQALLNVKGPVTAKSYNAAVRGLKNQSRRTCSASPGTSGTPCRTTSRTTGTSPSTTRTARSC